VHIYNYNDVIVTFTIGLIFLVFGIKFLLGRKKIFDALFGSKIKAGQMKENTVTMVSSLLIPFIGVIITMGGLIQMIQAVIGALRIIK